MTQEDRWESIKTAPKDFVNGSNHVGAWFLGWDGHEMDVTRWTVEYPCSEGVWMRNYEPTDYIDNINSWEPTHWMPLPAAPSVSNFNEVEPKEGE